MHHVANVKNVFRAVSSVALVAFVAACSGGAMEVDGEEMPELGGDVAGEPSASEPAHIGTASQPLFGFDMPSSCSDPTGTDSLLAALAVATARELRRWNPVADFYVGGGIVRLTSSGKARCADGYCMNTQALLDLQNDAARVAQVRPGVTHSPSILRLRLTWNHAQQAACAKSWFNNCASPDHELTLISTEPGACDTNYTFRVRSSSGAPLSSTLLSSTIRKLEDNLIWLDDEDNSYIRFQSSGDTVTVDPTWGLNEGGTSSGGTCAAACTMISRSNLAGTCCACNGTKTFKRAAWSATTYLCQ